MGVQDGPEYASSKQNIRETRPRPFVGSINAHSDSGIEFSLQDHLELVDWTGHVISDDKKGSIPKELLPIMRRLGVESETWLTSIKHYYRDYFSVLGALGRIKTFAQAQGRAWCRGQDLPIELYTVYTSLTPPLLASA
jgi:hypothetical protein